MKVKVLLEYVANTNHIGVFVAKELGFYEDLEVEVVHQTKGIKPDLLETNQVQFAFTHQQFITMKRDNNIDIKSIYAIYKNHQTGFISEIEKNIKRPLDFENTKYCSHGHSLKSKMVRHIAKNDGADVSTIHCDEETIPDYLTTPSDLCDFYWEFEGWGCCFADLANKPYNYISLKEYGFNFYAPIIVTNNMVAEKVKKQFIKATNKGYLYAKENPNKIVEIMQKYNPNVSKELILLSMSKIIDNINETGFQEEKIWEDFTNWLKEEKFISKEFEYEKAHTNEYI